MSRTLLFGFIITIAIGCSNDGKSRIVMADSKEGRKLQKERDSLYYEQEKKRFPSSTFDVLPINLDTLIAATRHNGVVLTPDAGRTWTSISNPGVISKLTIDDQKQIWGLYSWQGIHEADRSVLYLSSDLGRNWKEHELNTTEIFPANFYSHPGDKLAVIDYESKIYKLTSNDTQLKWQLVDSLKEQSNLNPWVRRKFVTDSKKRCWIFDEQGIFLIAGDTIKVY